MDVPKAEVLRVLRKAGFTQVADELAAELPEVVDRDRDRPLFDRYGVNLDVLVDRMGGSP